MSNYDMYLLTICIIVLTSLGIYLICSQKSPLTQKNDLPQVDNNKILDYITLIQNQYKTPAYRAVIGGGQDKYLLLVLLQDYLSKNHHESYDEYVKTLIDTINKLPFYSSLTNMISKINETISTDEGRKLNHITQPHDPSGYFHALWITFFIFFPGLFNFNLNQSKNFILNLCYTESRPPWWWVQTNGINAITPAYDPDFDAAWRRRLRK